ncbi:MAG: hypothetical protein OXH52_04100, partial [Gammaproteobacteria bacterium]|nr:hypothetical protein [Gammaproteobacteria bacterium]
MLAIDEEAAWYAFSFRGEADALNMCGTAGCEVSGLNVWTWVEAATKWWPGKARSGSASERAASPVGRFRESTLQESMIRGQGHEP